MAYTPSSFQLDVALTNVAAGFRAPGVIADMIFPIVRSTKMDGVVYDIDPDRQFLIPRDNVRGPGGEPNRLEFNNPDRIPYSCEDHSLELLVPNELVQNADVEALPAITTVQTLVMNIQLKRERSLITLLGGLTNTGSPGTKWDNSASGNFIVDILAQFGTVRNATGMFPNALVFPMDVWFKCINTVSFRAYIQYVMTPAEFAQATPKGILAAIFNMPISNIFMPDGAYNSAAPGIAPSIADVWGETCLLFCLTDPQVPGGTTQCLGCHPTWMSGPSGMGVNGFEVEREYIMRRKSDAAYVHNYFDQILLNAGAGYWFTNVLT